MKTLLPIMFICFSLSLLAQEKQIKHNDHQCGTTLAEDSNPLIQRQVNERWQEERDYYTNLVRGFQNNSFRSTANIRMVPVQLHTIRTTAGTGGISDAAYERAFDLANEYFILGGIHLYQCNSINYIDDDTYFDYDKTQMAALDAAHAVSNVLNIYVANTVTGTSGTICGHAQFPGGLDFAMLDMDCAQNGSTFAHEVAHYFNIYHTHQSGNELVDGSNCAIAGDLLCDTPADPNVSSEIEDNGCIYIGVSTDANGASYTPSTVNIMSYGDKDCRVEFTTGQYARMLSSIDNDRTYLTCSASLSAGFYSVPDAGNCTDNLDVDFCNVSTGSIVSRTWNFGDGNTSTDESPTHTYAAAGAYDVILTIGDGVSTDVETKNYEIAVGAVTPPFFEDFEAGAADLGRFNTSETLKNKLEVAATAANASSYGLMLEGDVDAANLSPYFSTPTAATTFGELWNQYYKSSASLCVDARNMVDLSLDFDIKQIYRYNTNYSNFRITVDGVQVAIYQADGTESWNSESLDLTAYVGSIITIGFEGSHKYDNIDNATFIDNIEITGMPVLPVEMTYFNARLNDENQGELRWETASETNNKGFYIEHSLDGGEWMNVGFVAGKGTTAEVNEYVFLDKNLFNGLNYYRLKQVDFDGIFEYSGIRTLQIEEGSQKELQLFPNPAKDVLNVFNENGQATIYNVLGQPVKRFQINNNVHTLPISNLPNGKYVLHVHRTNGSFVAQRFVKY